MITLTESAVSQVRSHMARQERVGVRLGIKKTGCNGYSYVMDYAQNIADDDVIFEQDGIKLVVDEASLAFLDGTQVDFVRDGLNSIFRFSNPNAASECGCGESFNL